MSMSVSILNPVPAVFLPANDAACKKGCDPCSSQGWVEMAVERIELVAGVDFASMEADIGPAAMSECSFSVLFVSAGSSRSLLLLIAQQVSLCISITPFTPVPTAPKVATTGALKGSEGPSSTKYSFGRCSLRSSIFKSPWLQSVVAAKALSFVLVLRIRQAAARVGQIAHLNESTLRFRWKLCAPILVPFSEPIFAPSSYARSIVRDLRQVRIPTASNSAVNLLYGTGIGPASARAIIAPQNGWPPKNGITTVRFPAAIPAAVVPAPPWWTTQDTYLNSQSWGTLPSIKTPLGSPSSFAPGPPQPLETRARSVIFTASKISFVMPLGLSTTIDPKPM